MSSLLLFFIQLLLLLLLRRWRRRFVCKRAFHFYFLLHLIQFILCCREFCTYYCLGILWYGFSLDIKHIYWLHFEYAHWLVAAVADSTILLNIEWPSIGIGICDVGRERTFCFVKRSRTIHSNFIAVLRLFRSLLLWLAFWSFDARAHLPESTRRSCWLLFSPFIVYHHANGQP